MTYSRIYFDTTTLVNNPIKDGIRRAAKEWLHGLLNLDSAESNLKITCVFGGTGRITHSRSYLDSVFDVISWNMNSNRPIEFEPNSIFFIPGYDLFVPELKFDFNSISGKSKIVSTVFDLLPLTNPEWFPETPKRFKEALYKQCFYSDGIIVNSSHVKEQLIKFFEDNLSSCDPNRIAVVPLAGKSITKEHIYSLESVTNTQRTNILCVGTIEPRKGHVELLESFIRFSESNSKIHLTIVGRLGWKSDAVVNLMKKASLLKPHQFTWIADASDEELEDLYRSAAITVYPSYDEGFGLPIVESLNRGIPVLTRKLQPFIEVSQGAHITFGEGGDWKTIVNVFENIESAVQLGSDRMIYYRGISREDSTKFLADALFTF